MVSESSDHQRGDEGPRLYAHVVREGHLHAAAPAGDLPVVPARLAVRGLRRSFHVWRPEGDESDIEARTVVEAATAVIRDLGLALDLSRVRAIDALSGLVSPSGVHEFASGGIGGRPAPEQRAPPTDPSGGEAWCGRGGRKGCNDPGGAARSSGAFFALMCSTHPRRYTGNDLGTAGTRAPSRG